MAADFAESSHYRGLSTRTRLEFTQPEDRSRGLTEEQICQLKIHFTHFIFELLRTCKMRQRIAATAVVYFRRFYLRNSFCKYDPRLVAPGCLYLASKVEESTMQAKQLVHNIKRIRKHWAYDVKHLLDMEMIILAEMDFNLVVFSPYRPLMQFLEDPAIAPLQLGMSAWAFCNDLYRTDLPLLYPPHLLALACIYMAAAAAEQNNAVQGTTALSSIQTWAEALEHDFNQVLHIAMELTKLYDAWRPVMSEIDANVLLEKVCGPARSPA